MKLRFALTAMIALSSMTHAALAAEGTPQGGQISPGRQVKVAAIAIGCGGDHDGKLALALDHLNTAGQRHVDIACLPEEFAGMAAEPIPGPTTDAVAKLAAQYGMYVICPICEQAGEEQYNTAVLIDRKGQIAGYYRKIFVFWSENVHASREGVKTFDTDFGRITILNCFDLNFPELWQEAAIQGAEIVFWPSACGGGSPLNGYAAIHNYYVVAVGKGTLIDSTGATLTPTDTPRGNQFITTFDLDRTFVHHDFTRDNVKRLLDEHKDDIEVERSFDIEGWTLLRSIKPGIRVRDLCKQANIETLQEYRKRSREQINQRRGAGQRIAADKDGNPL